MSELVPPDYLLKPEEFDRVFISKDGFGNLRQQAVDGRLGELCNRLTCWRVFLGLLPENGTLSDWAEAVTTQRAEYENLCAELQIVPQADEDLTVNNPLSASEENPWNSFHQDNELKERIRMDVERTYQERPLFQHEEIQNMMTSILFIWAKHNPDLGYKQGMNELLAIVLFIAFCEHCPKNLEGVSSQAEEALRFFNNPMCLEADVFALFNRIMNLGVRDLFNPVLKMTKGARPVKNLFAWDHEAEKNHLIGQDKSQESGVSSVLKRCHRIHHRFLQAIDVELYQHMEGQSVEPQMYLQRWLRCLLSRELTLAHTLIVWDAMFAALGLGIENRNEVLTGPLNASQEVVLLEFICVAMLVFVRKFRKVYTVLQSDTSGILQRLLKYPPIEDIREIVAMGLSFHTYILGGCASSKPSIIPGSIKAFNVKPVTAPKVKEAVPEPLSIPSKSQPRPPSPAGHRDSQVAFDPLLTPSVGLKVAGNKQPAKTESPMPVKAETPLPLPVESSPVAQPELKVPDSPSNSVGEPNEPRSKESLKEEVLAGIEGSMECLEEQIRLKAFNEVSMMRALDMLEKVRDIVLREMLSRK